MGLTTDGMSPADWRQSQATIMAHLARVTVLGGLSFFFFSSSVDGETEMDGITAAEAWQITMY